MGPVLVLSYKNHALDEFLLDVVNMTSVGNKPGMHVGKLIRLGKSDVESLLPYGEKYSVSETKAQEHLNRKIKTLKQSRSISRMWTECARDLDIAASSQNICVSLLFFYSNCVTSLTRRIFLLSKNFRTISELHQRLLSPVSVTSVPH